MKRKIDVEGYDRVRFGKRESVSGYSKQISSEQQKYINHLENKEEITIDNIGMLQYEVLSIVKLLDKEYNKKATKQDILDHLDDDELWIIEDTIENNQSQGLLTEDLRITPLGERIRKDWKNKYD